MIEDKRQAEKALELCKKKQKVFEGKGLNKQLSWEAPIHGAAKMKLRGGGCATSGTCDGLGGKKLLPWTVFSLTEIQR